MHLLLFKINKTCYNIILLLMSTNYGASCKVVLCKRSTICKKKGMWRFDTHYHIITST